MSESTIPHRQGTKILATDVVVCTIMPYSIIQKNCVTVNYKLERKTSSLIMFFHLLDQAGATLRLSEKSNWLQCILNPVLGGREGRGVSMRFVVINSS